MPQEGRTDMNSKVYTDTGPFSIVPEWLLIKVGSRAVHVYALLARCADLGGECYPSRRYLADRAHCSMDSVDRAIAELVHAEAVIVAVRRNKDGGQQSNNYLVIRKVPDSAAPPGQSNDSPLGAGAAQNENQMNENSVSVDHSENDLPQPPQAAPSEVAVFKEAVTEYLAANKGNRVSALVRIGDSLGYERNGGFAAALVRDFHEKLSSMRMVDAMVAGITARGDPWAYVRKALDGEARKSAWGRQGGAQPAEGTSGGLVTVSREEVEAALKAKADEAAGPGEGAGAG